MDLWSLVGVAIAFGTIVLGNFYDGGELALLFNGPAALIVFGGTIGATVLQTPMRTLTRGVRLLRWIVAPPPSDPSRRVQRLVSVSKSARRDGLPGVENMAAGERDRLFKKGLLLVADGTEPGRIREQLERELDHLHTLDVRALSIYEHMGGYAPTIGVIGAVLGLIHVMGNLAEPDQVGLGIATAFVATIYGVGFANLVLYPVAGRLREIVTDHTADQSVTIEGIVGIAEGEHPATLEARLAALVTGR